MRTVVCLVTALLCSGTVGVSTAAEPEDAARREHPFLFLTAADGERAREGVRDNETFAQLAQDLIHRATTNQAEHLPPLERVWWQSARDKPWGETYPAIFHHTFIVPMQWADLARACARATLLAPADGLSEKAKAILLRLADYTFEFEHYDVGMNYTLWAMAALETYDILYDTFTEEERARVDAFFERLLGAVRENDDYWVAHEPGGKLNNHYAWHKLCFCMLGLFYDRPELVEQAWHGPKGVAFMLEHGFKDNGLWLEGSIPYQFAATAPLLVMAKLLENAGHPLSLFRDPTADGMTLKTAYDALIPLLFPDRTLPTIGDCYARRLHLGQYPDWEPLYRRFGDPAYAWLLADRGTRRTEALFDGAPDLSPGSPPSQMDTLWPEMGYLSLRSQEGTNYWSGQGWTVFATYSNRTVHENRDKLSILLFADGHLWLPDCEARSSAEHAFSSQIQSRLNRETLCHNTMLVDGRSQRHPAQRLQLLEFERLPGVKRAVFGDRHGQLYPGVAQLRTIILRHDYVLDFYEVNASESHEFSWLIHIDGNSVTNSASDWNPSALPNQAPWSYLRSARQGQMENRFWECFSHGQQRLRFDLLSAGATRVLACGFPRDDRSEPETIPMRMFQRTASEVWFLALYRRVKNMDDPVELNVSAGELDSWEITVRQGGTEAVHIVPRLPVRAL